MEKRWKYGVLYSLFLVICWPVLGQQDSQYTQFIYNTVSLNPAYTGGRGRFSALALYRQQWVGISGAPKTLNLTVHSPVGRLGRVGVGAEFTSDEIGPVTQWKTASNFSYLIDFNRRFYISFGLKAGVHNLEVNSEKLHIFDHQNLKTEPHSKWQPILGIGIYFYTKSWYLGVSMPNVLKTTEYDDVARSLWTKAIQVYLIGGYRLPVNDVLVLKPSALVKAAADLPLSIDLALNSVWYKRFVVGVNYRWETAISGLVGFQITPKIMLGYAYDYHTAELSRYSRGSHEIFLRFELAPRRTWAQERFD